jgi:hypothetical protein
LERIKVNGFPRSGNTYLTDLLTQSFDIPVEFVIHKTADLYTKNCIVPIRKPEESIASWAKLNPHIKLEDIVKWYERFYTCILENADNLIILDFNYFTKEPISVVEDISKILNLKIKTVNISTLSKNANVFDYQPIKNEHLLNESLNLYNQVYKKV